MAHPLGTLGTPRFTSGPIAGYALGEGFNMMKRLWVLAVGLLLAIISASSTFAQNNKEGSSMPKVGDVAPDFTLKHFDGNNLTDVKLSDYRGKKNVVLAFYVFAFTGG